MVNGDLRQYPYYTYGDQNAYGQPQLSKEAQGAIKMAIYTTSQSVQDNINYRSAAYVGLTHESANDKMVIHYKDKLLKVLYISTAGRYKQVFMAEV